MKHAMKRAMASALVLAAAMSLAGCKQEQPAIKPAEVSDPVFLADNAIWRQERKQELTAPAGWTSLVGLHWLELKSHYVGSGAGSGIRLAAGPAKMGMVDRENGKVWFVPERGVALTLDGKPLKGRVRLLTDREDGGPSVLGFDGGKGQLTVIQRGDRQALRVKHADAFARTHFTGLDYWPLDKHWQLEGRFVPHEAGRTIPIVDIVGITTAQPNPGAVEFVRDGKTWRIEALADGAGGKLLLVFADRTSGHGSYPAGRFLDVDAPGKDGKALLDFNRAYDPPCAFTPFATCPLPPPENRLDLRIDAGEKAYAKPAEG